MADCLDGCMRRGEIAPAPPGQAASHYVGLILGDLQLRCLLRLGPPPTPRQRARVVRAGVAAFLRAYAPPAVMPAIEGSSM